MPVPRFNFNFKNQNKVKNSSNSMSDTLNTLIKFNDVELTDEQLDLLAGNTQTEEINTDELIEEPKEKKVEPKVEEKPAEKVDTKAVEEVKKVAEETDSKKFLDADERVESSKYSILNDVMAWAVKEVDNDKDGCTQGEGRWGETGYDCSTLVISAFDQAGFNVKELGASNCSDIKDAFLDTGKFEWIPGEPKIEDLQPGDVLLSIADHVEMYVGNGNNVGAHDDRDGMPGDGDGTEVDVQGYWSPPWDGVLRYKGD